VEKEIVSEDKDKPVLDQQALAKLLEAAYVLQEHNRALQQKAPGPELNPELKKDRPEAEERSTPAQGATPVQEATAYADYSLTLARIVETQHQIQVLHLDLESAMSLVAERLIQIARASGAAIGILDGKKLHYRASAGVMTLPSGSDVPMEKALCFPCLRTGEVLRSGEINSELLLDTEEWRRRGIQSLIAVPVFHDGGVAGGLELYYPNPQAFTEQDVHSCQLMAGLVTEALSRNEEATSKKSLASERAAMLEALDKLTPNLAAMVEKPAAADSASKTGTPATPEPKPTFVCRKCGHKLVGEEQFCGSCGTPRSSDYEPPSMQSKVASLWHMQEALKKTRPAGAAEDRAAHQSSASVERAQFEKSRADSREEEVPGLFASAERPVDKATAPAKLDPALERAEFEESVTSDIETPLQTGLQEEEEAEARQSTALAKPERAAAWSSAASTRDFLERLAPAQRSGALVRMWNTRRGDIYLAIAVLLVAGVLRWGIWSNHSVSATGSGNAASASHRKPDANLSLFDRMLISLGLAEAPPPPKEKGNPDVQVWVDLKTALYYCPGTDLYGKTPKGKFTSQRDAQMDQYEPAYRKPCD